MFFLFVSTHIIGFLLNIVMKMYSSLNFDYFDTVSVFSTLSDQMKDICNSVNIKLVILEAEEASDKNIIRNKWGSIGIIRASAILYNMETAETRKTLLLCLSPPLKDTIPRLDTSATTADNCSPYLSHYICLMSCFMHARLT